MGSHWPMLLLLLIGNGALHLPGIAAVWGSLSHTQSTSGSVSKGTVSCPTNSVPPHHHISTVEPNSSSTTRASTSTSQGQTSSAIVPTSPQTSSSTGSTASHTPITTTTSEVSQSNFIMTSTWKEQGETSGTTSNMVSAAENPRHNQMTPTTAPPASNSTTTQGTAIFGTTETEAQEETTAVSPAPATTLMTSKLFDAQHSTTKQTPAPPAQPASGVSTTPVTAPPASKPSTTQETTILGTTETEAQEETTAVSPAPATTLMTSKLFDAQHSTTKQTPAPLAQPASGVSTTPVTAPAASKPSTTQETTILGTTETEAQEETTAVSPAPATTLMTSKLFDAQHSTTKQTPAPPAQPASGVSTTPVTAPPASKPSTTQETTILGTTETEAQEETTAVSPTPATTLMTSKLFDAQHSTTKQTPAPPAQPASGVSTTPVTAPPASKPSTTQETTILGTTETEAQEETTAVSPTPATTLMTSKLFDAQHSTTKQTPAPPAQPASGVSTTPVTAPPASKPSTSGMSLPVSPDSEKAVIMTAPTTVNTQDNGIEAPGSVITIVSGKSALTPPSTSKDKATDMHDPLPMTTRAVIHTSSPNTASLGATDLGTTMTMTQEGETTAVLSTPATTLLMTKPSDTQPTTVQQTLSPPAQSTTSGTAESPEPTPDHSTALVPSSSMTTKSSAMAETSLASPKSSQSSRPQGGACALDEYTASTGDCMCNGSYYAHSELSGELMTLRCWPKNIEVILSSCFLETRHWALSKGALSGCPSTNKTEQDRRVQAFLLEKKEGTCGLHLSTNISHAQYSLEVQLVQVLPGSEHKDSRTLNFSCAYPLVVDVSQTLSGQVDSSHTIHISSTGKTVVTLSVFTDAQLSSPLKNSTAPVGTPLYVVLNSTNSDPGQFALVANEVFASTNYSKTRAKATYHFVNQSCPVDSRLLQDLVTNGASLQVTLAFTLKRYLNMDTFYLHARVSLCDKHVGRSCQPTCNPKNVQRRNSPWEIRTRNGVELGGGGEWIVFGPLRISESKASGSRSSTGAWTSVFLLMVIGWMLG